MESPIHRDFLVFLGATNESEFFDEATDGTSPFQSGRSASTLVSGGLAANVK